MASPEIEDAVLDATRDCVRAYGVRRTTVADVASRAGVSRMSIYRRWPDVRSLVAGLMSREWHRVLVGTAGAPQRRGMVRRRAVAQMVAVGAALRAHPLLRKIREADPEVLLPYMLDRRGASQDEMLAFVEEAVRAGQRDGSGRRGNARRLARAALLPAPSLVLSSALLADAYSEDELETALGVVLGRY